jgi:prepilin-type N-terminal cleavage/methylation domain-containing protein
MQKIKNKAFTLVELLVVITILAIISVVAYQNFG